MKLGMTLVYPVQWGVAIRGAHGLYRAPARCSSLSSFCVPFANNCFGTLPRRKTMSKTRPIVLQLVKFPLEREKKEQLITTFSR